ncbi:uncharacterized protein LOC108873108 isoform X2 [Scomber scombrus]|uniref:Uncharacterized protein LOC108873108 isoform X2 n=1 Tax=Scomber scombrus TaxID=13677 RepID=A0AAV1NN74_SCOSC
MWLLATAQLPCTELCGVLQDCTVHLSEMEKDEKRGEGDEKRDSRQLIESRWSETKSSVIQDQKSSVLRPGDGIEMQRRHQQSSLGERGVYFLKACKMAASAVSSGRQLADKCLPEYISTAMKTKDF